ncbi:MAG: hypothetical protein IJ657_01500 [Acidaminococcaceae bacterium]|nr:hypothetical protein [Acidaminococcaceae bacterium]
MTEKRLFREAKMPKKKPLTMYNAVLTIWLNAGPPKRESIVVPPKDKFMLQL